DSDGDGILDFTEGLGDPDGDAIPNYVDEDSDSDGIDDSVETDDDADQDGSPNFLDLDSDADGIPDFFEGIDDTDGDGVLSFLDSDSDADGEPDAQETVVVYASKDSPGEKRDGRYWESAFSTLQEAVDTVSVIGKGEVWAAAGVYDEERFNASGSLQIHPGVSVYGGFLGTERQKVERDWETNATVIDGSRSWSGGPATHTVLCGQNAVLDGFVVTGGYEDGGVYREFDGAGVLTTGKGVHIANCILKNNQAYSRGGGLFDLWGEVQLANCTFENNSAHFGGGAYIITGRVVNCKFIENTGGGLLIVAFGTITVENSQFLANHSRSQGGGIGVEATNSLQGDLVLKDCSFVKNVAMYGGGVATSTFKTVSIENCHFRENNVWLELYYGTVYGGRGGALGLGEGQAQVRNCVFAKNVAAFRGGAIHHEWSQRSQATFVNCSFATNVSQGEGGWGYLELNYGHHSYKNCIFWNNYPVAHLATGTGGGYEFVSSISQEEIGSGGVVAVDPAFVDESNGDFRLLPGSSAIDAGTSEGAPETDIRGVTRPQGAGVDIGAYEYLAWEVNGDAEVNALDVQLVINAALGVETIRLADLNGDATVDAVDVQLIINAALGLI
ncbi:MAG: right-handed parallel beta-helix repeat-containing protein, partial [Candidatus Hydrogenedentes bacterium]|nr:right-handed parallel beta-helix repeat-containing protein [Candidatus Hydrogenedentota bacterium]